MLPFVQKGWAPPLQSAAPVPPPHRCLRQNVVNIAGAWRLCDLRHSNSIKKINDFNPKIIFHLAAYNDVKGSFSNYNETLESNIIGTANLLENLKYLIHLQRFVDIGKTFNEILASFTHSFPTNFHNMCIFTGDFCQFYLQASSCRYMKVLWDSIILIRQWRRLPG